MPGTGTMLESQFPDDWAAARRNAETTEKHLRPPLFNARVYNDANISVAHNTPQALTFNSERWDVGDLHSTASNTSRLTAPITGLYHIGGSFRFAANAAGQRLIQINLNGTVAIDSRDSGQTPNAAIPPRMGIDTIYRLTRGDYVELVAFQTSGGALNVESVGNFSPEFWAYRIGGYTHEGVANP